MNKELIETTWKASAAQGRNTAAAHAQLCIFRAIASKNEDNLAVAKHLLRKAFTPVSKTSKLVNGRTPFDTVQEQFRSYRWGGTHKTFLGVPLTDIMNEEEEAQYHEIAKALSGGGLVRRYSYFFTRQDIFDEYQLVQTAHAALELGATLTTEQVKDLHFTCCGVADLEELEAVERVLEAMKVRYITFREPDIGNQKTSIAVEPIEEHRRGLLRGYNLLRFNRNVTVLELNAEEEELV